MILYHGTSSANCESIFTDSYILSRKDAGNWFKEHHLPSIKEFVYFGKEEVHCDFHALRTALLTNSECVILQVELEEDNLYPDENFFQKTLLYDTEAMAIMQTEALENKDKWKNCLIQTGVVCHKGDIPAGKIKKAKNFPIEESMHYSFVKHTEKTLDAFDMGFHIFLQLQNGGWFVPVAKRLEDEGLPSDEVYAKVMRNLEIKPIHEKKYSVRLFEQFAYVEVG